MQEDKNDAARLSMAKINMRRPGMLCRVFSRAKWTMYNKESTERKKTTALAGAKAWRCDGLGKRREKSCAIPRTSRWRGATQTPHLGTVRGHLIQTGFAWQAWLQLVGCALLQPRQIARWDRARRHSCGDAGAARKRARAHHYCSLDLVRCGWMPFPLFSSFRLILWKLP